MINLMYLVLTALLALNVSAEILNAFKTVNRSIEGTNGTINASTANIMESLQTKMGEPETKEKATIWYAKAKQIQDSTTALVNYINTLKGNIYTGAHLKVENGDSTFKEDDQDVATRILADGRDGQDLLARLTSYKKNMLAIDPIIAAEFKNSLQIDLETPPTKAHGGAKHTWQGAYFRMVPTVAAITMLSKFQNDVKTTENKLVAFCHQQVGQVMLRFDAFEAIVGQNSKYLMPGQEIEITAGLGAFSKAKLPTVTIGGSRVPLNEKGMAIWKTNGGGIGTHTIPVTVAFTDQDGKEQTRTFPVEYTVGQSATAISLTKMNVLYIGVDNPVSIASSGGAEKLAPSIVGGGGSLSKVGPGQYIARVSSVTDDCRIVVNVDGKTQGQQVFRVRTIPDPVATVGGFASGENVNAGAFRAQGGVAAWIKDFPFELKYSVQSFVLEADTEEGDIVEAPCTGNTWSPLAARLVRNVKPGQLVTIRDIRAMGPDGRSRKLPGLYYTIK